MERGSSQFEERVKAAEHLLDQGICSEAADILSELLEKRSLPDEVEARVRTSLSLAYDTLGIPTRALDVVEKYESNQIRQVLKPTTQVRVLIRLGRAWDKLREVPRALSSLNAALKLAEEISDLEGLGLANLALGRAYRVINESTLASDALDRSLEQFRLLGNRRNVALAYLEKGMVSWSEGEHETALGYFVRTDSVIQDEVDYFILGSRFLNTGGIKTWLRECEEATNDLEKAYGFFSRAKHQRMLAHVCTNLGQNLITLGDWQRAEQVLREAVSISREYDERRVWAAALDNLGQILLFQGRVSEAARLLDEGIVLVQSMNARWDEVQLRFTRTKVYFASGETEASARMAAECSNLARKIDNDLFETRSILLQAEIALAASEDGLAETLLEQARTHLSAKPDLTALGLLRRIEGRVMRKRGLMESAHHSFLQGLAVFEILKDAYQTALAKAELGNLFVATGDVDKARAHYEAALTTLESLNAAPDVKEVRSRIEKLNSPGLREKSVAFVGGPSIAAPQLRRILHASLSFDLLITEILNLAQQVSRAEGAMICRKGRSRDALKVLGAKGTAEHRQKELVDRILAGNPAGQLDGIFHLCPQLEDGYTLVLDLASELPPETSAQLQPLLTIFEQELELAHLRAKPRSAAAARSTSAQPEIKVPGFIHSSASMSRVLEQIHKIRSSSVTVLITGESGTGKELVARAIHAESARSQQKFVPFNCTATTKELVDAHLFGYRRGAFTGAATDSPGMIRAAEHGTLFLDEIGDLALEVQPKLLRFLQEGEIQPLGEKMPVKVDVRVVAATNSDLEQKVAEGRFREDLFHRLNVIRLHIPPLRERREEIPLFIHHFLSLYSEGMHKEGVTLSQEAIELMGLYDWPGNVRQLGNEIRRIVTMADSNSVAGPESLSGIIRDSAAQNALRIRAAKPAAHANGIYVDPKQPLSQAVSQLEKEMLTSALRRHRGNISKTAAELGLTRKGLYIKKARLGIES